jgi:hypothetical protein
MCWLFFFRCGDCSARARRAVFALLRVPWKKDRRSHECERGTLRSVRYALRILLGGLGLDSLRPLDGSVDRR